MDTIPISQTHTSPSGSSCVPKTVYYLTHRDTGQRERYYKSLAGARIAQRARPRLLGFDQRLERCALRDNWEVELCRLRSGDTVTATWVIEEDTIEHLCDTGTICEENPGKS